MLEPCFLEELRSRCNIPVAHLIFFLRMVGAFMFVT